MQPPPLYAVFAVSMLSSPLEKNRRQSPRKRRWWVLAMTQRPLCHQVRQTRTAGVRRAWRKRGRIRGAKAEMEMAVAAAQPSTIETKPWESASARWRRGISSGCACDRFLYPSLAFCGCKSEASVFSFSHLGSFSFGCELTLDDFELGEFSLQSLCVMLLCTMKRALPGILSQLMLGSRFLFEPFDYCRG